jgi:chorismate mutase
LLRCGTLGKLGIARKRVVSLSPMSDSAPAALAADAQLAAFRRSIDNIDAALIHILAERFRITQAVGEYKARNELPPADPAREHEQIARLRKLAEDSQLDPEFSEKFLRFIIDEVIRHHEKARGG